MSRQKAAEACDKARRELQTEVATRNRQTAATNKAVKAFLEWKQGVCAEIAPLVCDPELEVPFSGQAGQAKHYVCRRCGASRTLVGFRRMKCRRSTKGWKRHGGLSTVEFRRLATGEGPPEEPRRVRQARLKRQKEKRQTDEGRRYQAKKNKEYRDRHSEELCAKEQARYAANKEEIRARRAYLRKCAEDGREPVSIARFKAAFRRRRRSQGGGGGS